MTDYRKRLEADLRRCVAMQPQATNGGPPVNYCHVREADLSKLLSEGERMRRKVKSELDYIDGIAKASQQDLEQLLQALPVSKRSSRTSRALSSLGDRMDVLIQCASDARQALGDPDQ